MDEAGFFELQSEVWHWVDRGQLVARLTAAAERPAPAEIDDRFGQFFTELCTRLRRRRLEEGRAWLRMYEDCVELLDDAPVHDAPGRRALFEHQRAIVPLFGERYFYAVTDNAARFERLDGTTLRGWEIRDGIWRAIHDRWREQLLVDIPIAFDAVPYPGDEDVISNDWGTTEECCWFCGQDWRAVDPQALYPRYADLSFFKDAGFRYLIPAFMRASIMDPDGEKTCGAPIDEWILYALASHRDPQVFDAAQRAVLLSFLELNFGRNPPPEFAIAVRRLSG